MDKEACHHKYLKYKQKYIFLKNNKEGGNNLFEPSRFYLLHGTQNFTSMITILKEGVLKPGKDVQTENRFLSGQEPSEFVFFNMYFPDIQNLKHARTFTLIFHPKIIKQYGALFNRGWQTGHQKKDVVLNIDEKEYVIHKSISLNKNDNVNILSKKIKKIEEYLKNPDLPPKIKDFSELYHHELLIKHSVELKNNLLAVICSNCSDEMLSELKRLVDKNVKILSYNSPLPQFQ